MAVGWTLQTVVLYADIQIELPFHHNLITFGKSARVENVENHSLLRMVKDGGSRSWKTAFLVLLCTGKHSLQHRQAAWLCHGCLILTFQTLPLFDFCVQSAFVFWDPCLICA